MVKPSNDRSHSYDEENKVETGTKPKPTTSVDMGRLKEVKDREAELLQQLSSVREQKRDMLRSKPLTIGVVGFGRFGQFIARSFSDHACRVVATSRSDYTDIAEGMGVTYIPLSDPASFINEGLDVIVLAVSILSFENTVKMLKPHLEQYIEKQEQNHIHNNTASPITGPLIVDVLSVKEHPREILLDQLPPQCDILCTHPMFGPDSGKYSWEGLNFVFERTRINNVVYDPDSTEDIRGSAIQPNYGYGYVEGLERMERFLSIWEEKGCRMVPMSCRDHDKFASNSQFVTHLMGRILGDNGLQPTPIDTKGFESVLKLVGTTTADSFDLFYGLYKYNRNSMETIQNLKNSMNDVVEKLMEMEKDEKDPSWMNGCITRKLSLKNTKTYSIPLMPSIIQSTLAEPNSETLVESALKC